MPTPLETFYADLKMQALPISLSAIAIGSDNDYSDLLKNGVVGLMKSGAPAPGTLSRYMAVAKIKKWEQAINDAWLAANIKDANIKQVYIFHTKIEKALAGARKPDGTIDKRRFIAGIAARKRKSPTCLEVVRLLDAGFRTHTVDASSRASLSR